MKSNKGLGATIGYNLKDESQLIAVKNLQGNCIEDYEKQMQLTQTLFEGRAKNLTAHIILSPGVEDGNRLTIEQWREIADSYLEKTKLDKNEAVVFLHNDKDHKHLHIVANRIDDQGKIYRNGSELHMSQRVGNEIAGERGMLQAREVMKQRRAQERERGAGLLHNIEHDMKKAQKEVIQQYGKFEQQRYFEELRKSGYEVKIHSKKNGEVRGYGVGKDNQYYNASQVGKSYTLTSLDKSSKQEVTKVKAQQRFQGEAQGIQQTQVSDLHTMRKNLEKKTGKREQEQMKKEMESDLKELRKQKYENTQQYFDALKKAGYEVQIHNDKETGLVRGYGIEKDGVFYNASDIGRKYTLKELEKSNVIQHQEKGNQIGY